MWVSFSGQSLMMFEVFLTKEKGILSKSYKVILSEKGKKGSNKFTYFLKVPCFSFKLFKPFKKCTAIHPARFICIDPILGNSGFHVVWTCWPGKTTIGGKNLLDPEQVGNTVVFSRSPPGLTWMIRNNFDIIPWIIKFGIKMVLFLFLNLLITQ